MSKASDIELTCIADLMRSNSRHKASLWRRPKIAKAVEMVVDDVDPRIRVVSRYNKRLRNAVDTTWQYLNTLKEHVPGDMRISRASFSIDPRVRVLFENVDAMLKLFTESSQLIEFFKSHQESESAYALLSMEKNEKTFFGVGLSGEMLRRDVMQTAVTFSDHLLLSPASTAQAAKDGIMCCLFAGLLRKVNRIIMESHFEVKNLEEKKQHITGEIRRLKAAVKNTESGNLIASASIEKLHYELMEVERDLVHSKLETDSPDRHLQIIVDVLSDPEQHVKIKHNTVSVNNLGIKSKHAHNIEYAEMAIEKSLRRVAMVVSFQKDDLFDITMNS